jgi:multiple sugar transport system substrate-binding protein
MLVGWRSDILKQLGYNTPPRTYSQVIAMGQKFPDKFIWVDNDLVLDEWSQRLFDLFPFYDAASNGHSFMSSSKLTVDNTAAVDTLKLMNSLRQNNLLLTQNVNNPFETGVSVMEFLGPWTYTAWAQQMTAWNFIKWVFSDPQHDKQWPQKTDLPPARDDLITNKAFTSFFQQHPELEAYAQEIPYAVPPMKNPKYTDLLTALGDNAVIPVVKGQKGLFQAWNDWKPYAQSALSSLS